MVMVALPRRGETRKKKASDKNINQYYSAVLVCTSTPPLLSRPTVAPKTEWLSPTGTPPRMHPCTHGGVAGGEGVSLQEVSRSGS